jgi:hypothetical protein
VVYCTAAIYIPTLFACQRSDCESAADGEGCERVGQALVDDGLSYGCPEGDNYYNPSATIMVKSGEVRFLLLLRLGERKGMLAHQRLSPRSTHRT